MADGLDLEQGKEVLLLLGRADLAGDGVAGLQVESTDLRGRDIDVLRAGQVAEALRAQETKPLRQHFQHAFRVEPAALLGVLLEDVEDDLVLAHGAEVLDLHLLGHGVEIADRHLLQLGDVDLGAFAGLGFGCFQLLGLEIRIIHRQVRGIDAGRSDAAAASAVGFGRAFRLLRFAGSGFSGSGHGIVGLKQLDCRDVNQPGTTNSEAGEFDKSRTREQRPAVGLGITAGDRARLNTAMGASPSVRAHVPAHPLRRQDY